MVSQSLQEICCCLGQPLAGNPTQYLAEKALARAGLDWRFLTLEVPPEDLAAAMQGFRAMRFRGASIADPHRTAVMELVDDLTDEARRAGAVSGVTRQGDRLIGDCFEGKGFLAALKKVIDAAGKSVLILDDGETAREITAELAAAGASALTLVHREGLIDDQFAARIAADRECTCQIVAADAERLTSIQADIVVPVLSPAIARAKLADLLTPDSLTTDTVVATPGCSPQESQWLREAQRKECQVVDGLTAKVQQIAVALRVWADIEVDLESLHEALEEYLGV